MKSECLRLLATLRLDPAQMQLICGFIDTYLRLTAEEEEIFRTEVARFEQEEQEVVMEIVTSWMEEGLQRGRLEGELAVIMRLLRRSLFLLPAYTKAKVPGD